MKKRRFPRISPTMARRVVMVMLIIALGIPLMGCQVLVLWMDDNAHIDRGAEVVTTCSYCGAVFNARDATGHGPGKCNKKEEKPQEEEPPAATCQVCQGTLAEGESHAAPCGSSAHCTKDGKTHDAASCGTSGHYTCDGKKHDKLACGHYTCDGKKHEELACGHYACDSGSHGAAACGVEGHFACDDGLHGACGACGEALCDGHGHKVEVTIAPTDPAAPDDADVSAPAPITCPGCGAQVGDTTDHMAPCRNDSHLTCAADYVAEPHVNYADCNDHNLCDSRDHSRCICSIPLCSSKYVAAEHGALGCGRHCKYQIHDTDKPYHAAYCAQCGICVDAAHPHTAA